MTMKPSTLVKTINEAMHEQFSISWWGLFNLITWSVLAGAYLSVAFQ